MSENTISITLISSLTDQTENISLAPNSPLSNLKEWAIALLGIPADYSSQFTKDGQPLPISDNMTIGTAGLKNGDVIFIISNPPAAQRPPAPAPAPAPAAMGGLDFSSLLAQASAPAPPPAAAAAAAPSSGFHIRGLNVAVSAQTQQKVVEWSGMNLDDAIARNPNPALLVPLLFSPNHPNLLKELNYHSPDLSRKLRAVDNMERRIVIWREELMKGGIKRAMDRTSQQQKEKEMEGRLKTDPMDEEANNYFGEKIRKENVEEQYRQMIEEHPESLSKILMLYIPLEVNSHPIQAFVDSGAESTIMSSKTAEKCGILHLLDTRFAGTAVGVGTGKILGRVHLCPIKINGHHFPCTITVLERDNMEFLFGLDMLKRHRCRIDLDRGVLGLKLDTGMLEVGFLHEKDLDQSKGGTKGFDADKNNEELEKAMDKMDEE